MKSTNKSTIKNAFKAFGIIALAALIVFSMMACDDGVGGPGGNNPGGGGGGGRLTVTGLPQGGRWSAYVFPQSVTISSGYGDWDTDNFAEAWDLIERNEGNTFQLTPRGSSSSVPWTGSGSRTVAMHFWGSAYGDYTATVNFSNGNATVPFSIFTQLPD